MEQDKQRTQNIPLQHISMITVHWKHNISLCVCVCVVTELHVTVNYIKILSFAQHCCNGKPMSQATMQN